MRVRMCVVLTLCVCVSVSVAVVLVCLYVDSRFFPFSAVFGAFGNVCGTLYLQRDFDGLERKRLREF